MPRCKAIARHGQPCKNEALPGSDYCEEHQHFEELFRQARSATDAEPWWQRLLRSFGKEPGMNFDPSRIDERLVRRALAVVVGIIVLIALVSRCVSVTRITGDQVAVIMNNLTRKPALRIQSGAIVYSPFFQDVYVLDKTRQTLEMTAAEGRGDRRGKDDVKIKTNDGSDVDVDITINYEISDPTLAVQILETSGPDDAYKTKWIRDYARTICRNEFGELDTESFYDAREREAKAGEARDALNEALERWGIRVTTVIPQKFEFYKEYEEKIREKKERDQEIEEQKAKAEAAKERQKFVEMEEQKKLEVEVARFKGEIEQQRIAAGAEKEKVMREADAYEITTKAGADAEFIKLENEAKGILATRTAEAEGLRALADALCGPGGRNLVKMAYARQIENLRVTGTPVAVDSLMEKFEHSGERPAKAAAVRPAVSKPRSQRR